MSETRKSKMEMCRKCGCELSLKELFSTGPFCACCYRNLEDVKLQRREREYRYMSDNVME